MDGIASQAVDLLIVGMGTVFSFLALLVVATTLMSRLVAAGSTPEKSTTTAPPPPSQNLMEDKQLVAVISAALHKHRSGKH